MFGSRRTPGIGAILLLLVGLALLLSRNEGGERDRSGREQAPAGDAEEVVATVTRVVDGDTVEVSLDGAIDDVRYIGVDTPESVAPGQPVECFGHRASEFNRTLVEGERVRLVFDEERRDRYGRLLAYVYVGPLFVNAELVRRGYARTLAISPNTSRAAMFERLARQAGSDGRGLWSACGA